MLDRRCCSVPKQGARADRGRALTNFQISTAHNRRNPQEGHTRMPIYENVALPYSIAPGESATPIISTDNVQGALPFKSERVALLRGNNTTPQHLSAELQFSAAPGAYTWQIETADTDIDVNYSIEGTVTTSVRRIELSNLAANFARIRVVTLTNAVTVT